MSHPAQLGPALLSTHPECSLGAQCLLEGHHHTGASLGLSWQKHGALVPSSMKVF